MYCEFFYSFTIPFYFLDELYVVLKNTRIYGVQSYIIDLSGEKQRRYWNI